MWVATYGDNTVAGFEEVSRNESLAGLLVDLHNKEKTIAERLQEDDDVMFLSITHES